MAWLETCSVKEKARFCMAWESGEASMSELCRQFGIGRKTGYQVLARWRSESVSGLAERSHAPRSSPHALSKCVRDAVVALRRAKPTWGPKKLKRRLELDHPRVTWPATSTIGDLLARTGLGMRHLARHRWRIARKPTTRGPWTSRAGSAPAMGRVAIV
jgi:putative transposase